MPLLALTSGGDPAECFLRDIGIDDTEFVAPGSPSGHVHLYTGWDGAGNPWSSVAGGNTYQDTYAWWKDPANLLRYDLLFNACDYGPIDRNALGGAGDAYQAVHVYLEGGGRVFATHFFYNWFAPPTGPADFQSVAAWSPSNTSADGETYLVDYSFPKGKALADWLQANGTSTTYGEVQLWDTRRDVTGTTSQSTRWIYQGSSPSDPSYAVLYLSFNTPLSSPPSQQCGRAVFSDIHLAGNLPDSSPSATFPAECADPDPAGVHTNSKRLLEFLFFDLSSCVQDDTQPPPPPTK
jgi:hypothetical protein